MKREFARQKKIVAFLLNPKSYPHKVQEVVHVETHISHLFLTGEFAYKLKKPVQFDFRDFSSLEKRKKYCEEELRLNQRYAKELYLEVVPVTVLAAGELSLDAEGKPVEYTVKMRQFNPENGFDVLLKRGKLTDELLSDTTDQIVEFHRSAENASDYFSLEDVEHYISDNIEVCLTAVKNLHLSKLLEEIKELFHLEISTKKTLISARQKTHVKELHGDLHLGNICLYKGKPLLFDGIEFNPAYAACDPWADLAFLVMDLQFNNAEEKANFVINRYLERGDDFEGVRLLNLYIAYRAAVRAKVEAIRLSQNPTEDSTCSTSIEAHLLLAKNSLHVNAPRIITIGGFSGSGKSTLAKLIAPKIGAIIIRSDAVRKHIFNVPLDENAPRNRYSEACSNETYRAMRKRAEDVLASGRPVILDGVFGKESTREEVQEFAKQHSTSFTGLWCEVAPEIALARIEARKGDLSDATGEVFRAQVSKYRAPLNWSILDMSEAIDKTLSNALKILA